MSRYDAVVIGAGMGGLVCGCTLAKAGRRVAVVEQNRQPGGCATSFRRKGFTFDAGVNALAGCAPGQPLGRVLSHLGVTEHLSLAMVDPKEVVVGPDVSVAIRVGKAASLEELVLAFPAEACGLEALFEHLWEGDLESSLGPAGAEPFSAALERFLRDVRLKGLLGFLLGNLGLPPSRVSFAAARVLLRDFVFGGGAYPLGGGGIGTVARALAERFRALGGDLLLGQGAEKIEVEGGRARGVILEGGERLDAQVVVSNADARQTFYSLVGREHLPGPFLDALRRLEASPSAFLVFLGLDRKVEELCGVSSNFLGLFHWDSEEAFRKLGSDAFLEADDYVYCLVPSAMDPTLAPPGGESVYLLALAPFRDEAFWRERREALADRMIGKAELFLPGISRHVAVRETATPQTFVRETRNHEGAIYGWASVPGQVGRARLPQDTPIRDLLLVGHWTQPGPGVGTAAYSGYLAARQILREGRSG